MRISVGEIEDGGGGGGGGGLGGGVIGIRFMIIAMVSNLYNAMCVSLELLKVLQILL